MTIVGAVVALARSLGVVVEEPVPLRSTNNTVMWLRPSPVVAKVTLDPDRAASELAIAHVLTAARAPVVPPAPGVGHQVYDVGEGHATFWRYEAQDNVTEPSSEAIADALFGLHLALEALGPTMPVRAQGEDIDEVVRALDRPDFAPELQGADPRLLRQVLSDEVVALNETTTRRIIHGSPHRLNILMVGGWPRFIDFETVQEGPIERDLASLEPAVAEHYPGLLDPEILQRCRLVTSATASAWCWGGLDRGADMRGHAEHHLAVVRSMTA